MEAAPIILGGFAAVALPLSSELPLKRWHYVKVPRESKRTLLVANFDGSEQELRRAYAAHGSIESASVGIGSSKVSRVVFADEGATASVLSGAAGSGAAGRGALGDGSDGRGSDSDGEDDEEDEEDDDDSGGEGGGEGGGDGGAPRGLRHWLSAYYAQRPGAEALQEEVDEQMRGYDARVQEQERDAAQARNQADADGFVTVTRRARRNTQSDEQGTTVRAASTAQANAHAAAKEGAPKGTFDDFYRFQVLLLRLLLLLLCLRKARPCYADLLRLPPLAEARREDRGARVAAREVPAGRQAHQAAQKRDEAR